MSATAGSRGRRTESELVADVRSAVLEELAEVGVGRLTMEGVAKRAATAKTSLYRHWGTPHDILLDALEHEFPQEPVSPNSDNLREDLIRSLRLMTEWLATPTARAVASIISEQARYPELTRAVYANIFDAKGGRFTRTVLSHYAEHGWFSAELVTPVVADIGEALVLKHALDAGALPDADVLAAIVDQAILPAVGVAAPAGSRHAEET
ncbi:AcrR family transcriptional regulator [Lipingzhangella halophila]|uniref:AcrR family transcriptional regulator n=1 Tax=Lipingzhangella halophila TaxID=1783352 RepID=A0A7W7RP01_9ACTN|nr:TetR/AcrR family transcriptional regulator [Lipingzhangella halophila]MBB4935537.1 AcrR family transcriptional regulator [Lipingzhangella halophila]